MPERCDGAAAWRHAMPQTRTSRRLNGRRPDRGGQRRSNRRPSSRTLLLSCQRGHLGIAAAGRAPRGKRASAVAPSRSASSDPATSPRSAHCEDGHTGANMPARRWMQGCRSACRPVTCCCSTPDAAARAVPARLLLLCLLLRSSWLTVERGRQIGAAGVHRRGGRAAVAAVAAVAVGVPLQQRQGSRLRSHP
jgi:hypothetical protein